MSSLAKTSKAPDPSSVPWHALTSSAAGGVVRVSPASPAPPPANSQLFALFGALRQAFAKEKPRLLRATVAALAQRSRSGHDSLMSRDELIKRIQSLSATDLRRVAPFIESDLELLADSRSGLDLKAMAREIRAGQKSARTEPLLSDKEVQARLGGRSKKP